ncbi:MAG TPA: hypothetical protein DEA96_07155, partial [Leptospiraceae bacterium]|nr:hypothetical protein [Leptospiraceae bacterium]
FIGLSFHGFIFFLQSLSSESAIQSFIRGGIINGSGFPEQSGFSYLSFYRGRAILVDPRIPGCILHS